MIDLEESTKLEVIAWAEWSDSNLSSDSNWVGQASKKGALSLIGYQRNYPTFDARQIWRVKGEWDSL